MARDVLQLYQWEALKEMWAEVRPITMFRGYLFHLANVQEYSEEYSIDGVPLYVPIAGSATKKYFLGTLYGIAPGFVLFEPDRREDRALLGLMEIEEGIDALYRLKPFSPPDKNAAMSFVCTGDPSAPVYMSCIVGRGSAARTHFWHIPPDEWLRIGKMLQMYLLVQ